MSPFWQILRGCLIAFNVVSPVIGTSVQFTNSVYSGITAGSNFQITWSGDNTMVTLQLLSGDSVNLQAISTIGSATLSPFTWAVPADLAPATYALSITQSGVTNYSPTFEIMGGTPTTTVTTISSSTTSTPTLYSTSSTALVSTSTSTYNPLAPTPLYIAHGLFGGTNGSFPNASGTKASGAALPTGSGQEGGYAFAGGAAGEKGGKWWGLVLGAVGAVVFQVG